MGGGEFRTESGGSEMNLKPEELVKALRYCSNDYPCKTCPVELQKDESTCIGVLFKLALTRSSVTRRRLPSCGRKTSD